MSPWIASDELWDRLEPLLPQRERRFRDPGRKALPDREVRCGISYVLHTGIQWEYLPQELGFGSGMTCWRRLRDWNEAGVWQRLHEVLLAELNSASRLDWSRCVGDSSHVRALKKGGRHTGRSPVDRGRPGSKHHVITDGHGTPLAVLLTGATATTSPSFCPCSTRSRRSAAESGVPAADPTRSSPTVATTTTSTATKSAPEASCRPSPGAELVTAQDWAPTGGWWSGCAVRRLLIVWR
jgi:transposase